jgi:hypothetical protein
MTDKLKQSEFRVEEATTSGETSGEAGKIHQERP